MRYITTVVICRKSLRYDNQECTETHVVLLCLEFIHEFELAI